MNESHERKLSQLCRVCGHLLEQRNYEVKKHERNIEIVYQISTKNDSSIHPKYFCLKCYSSLSNSLKRNTTVIKDIYKWTEHVEGDCKTCDRFNELKKGIIGRKSIKSKTGSKRGRPKSNAKIWTQEIINAISLTTPNDLLSENLNMSDFQKEINPCLELCICNICNNILRRPMLLSRCEHTFCFNCIISHLKGKNEEQTSCPICKEQIYLDTLSPCSYVLKLLDVLVLQCYQCNAQFNAINDYKSFNNHIHQFHNNSNSYNNLSNSANSSSSLNLSAIFDLSPSKEIPREVEEATLHVIRNKMAQSNLPNKSIVFKSGGPRVSSFILLVNE